MAGATSQSIVEEFGRLGKWPRITCAFIGILALGAGAAAVFISKNTLGTAALLVIGAVYCFVGFTGIPIVRVALGNFGIELAQIARRAMDSPNPEVKLEVATIVLDSELPPTSSVRRQAEALNASLGYEAKVIAALSRIGGNSNVQIRSVDQRVDAVIRFREKRVGVEVKFMTHAGSIGFEQAVTQARFLLSGQFGHDLDGIIVVINQSPSALEIGSRQEERLRVVVWRSPNDDDALRDALRDLSN